MHPKTNPIKSDKKDEKDTNKLASIKQLPFLFLPNLLKRSTRSLNISKHKNYPRLELVWKNHMFKLPYQVTILRMFSKSKKLFLSLKAKNIDNIQKIIKGDGKPKL